MSVLRAFIAIELPATTQEALCKQTARLQQTLGDDLVRWVSFKNIHLTLKFLGDINSSHVDFLTQMLIREVDGYTTFDLQIGGLGSFPNSKRARVIWVGLEAPTSLASLQRSIEAETSRLGYEKEDRSFSPHLTIGRVRPNLSRAGLQTIHHAIESVQLGNIPAFRVDSIHLFKSELKPTGSVYTKLFSAKLEMPQSNGAKFILRGDP